MTKHAEISDPVILIRIPRAFRDGMSNEELYEATRGVWKIGPRRDHARYALAVHRGLVLEVYEITYWQPAWTTPYTIRKFPRTDVPGRWEFVGTLAPEPVRTRYKGKSVAKYFTQGGQNPITYVRVPP